MITLYKYTTLEGAFSIIESNTIGFSCAENLNDPFELRGASYRKKGIELEGTNGVIANFSRKLGILSLTRTHLNPIMWSLYSNNHRGVVIAFDVEKSGFNDNSFIPARHGSVIYTKTHPENVFHTEHDCYSDVYDLCKKHHYSDLTEKEKELASMFFLYKSDRWYHEEEVRVVKNLENSGSHHSGQTKQYQNQSGEWVKIPIDNRPLHCLKLPKGSISRIYVGACASENFVDRTVGHSEMIKRLLSADVPVSSVKIKKHSWELEDGYFYNKDGKIILHE